MKVTVKYVFLLTETQTYRRQLVAMANNLEHMLSSVCVVCNQKTEEALTSVYSRLTTITGSIHSHMSQVVGCQELQLACQTSQVVCSLCLNILLTVVNLECQLISLKNEFRGMFQRGTESRKIEMQESVGDQVKIDLMPDADKPGAILVICDDYKWIENSTVHHENKVESERKLTDISQETLFNKNYSKNNISTGGLPIFNERESPISFKRTTTGNDIIVRSEQCDENIRASDNDIIGTTTHHSLQADNNRKLPSPPPIVDQLGALQSYSDAVTYVSEHSVGADSETDVTNPLKGTTEQDEPHSQSQLEDSTSNVVGSVNTKTSVKKKVEFISGDIAVTDRRRRIRTKQHRYPCKYCTV